MPKEELLKPRYKVIADYPFSDCIIGEIFTEGKLEKTFFDNLSKYPHIFKKLEWWQERTIEQLQSVKFVKVIEYVGYWLVGDIVPAEFKSAKGYGYYLKSQNHWQSVITLLPATLEEYESQSKK